MESARVPEKLLMAVVRYLGSEYGIHVVADGEVHEEDYVENSVIFVPFCWVPQRVTM